MADLAVVTDVSQVFVDYKAFVIEVMDQLIT